MKKYYLSTNILCKYNEVKGVDFSDSIEFYSTPEECMKFACQNLIIYANEINDLDGIKEYITHEQLSKPRLNFKMKNNIASCIIKKKDNELIFEVSQTLIANKNKYNISILYQFVVNEIEEEDIGYMIVGKFDSESCSYNEKLSDDIFDTLPDMFKEMDKIRMVGMKNLVDFIICVADKKYIKEKSFEEYEKIKRSKLY